MTGLRRSTSFLQLLLVLVLLAVAACAHAAAVRRSRASDLELQAALVRRLELTDLCVFTDARYTRHPSQADAVSALQDHPGALDRFPSGSVAARPW